MYACRLTGRAVFRQDLVSRVGVIIEIPHNLAQQSAMQLAAYLQPRLEAAAGGSLDLYRK